MILAIRSTSHDLSYTHSILSYNKDVPLPFQLSRYLWSHDGQFKEYQEGMNIDVPLLPTMFGSIG